MSNIRRQSIISSVVIYFGFAIGLLNTYLFTKEGLFTEEQYGLTGILLAIAIMMSALANMAMPSYIYKFYHYYNDNLPPKKNDMITWSLLISCIGFVFILIAGVVFKHLVVRKFGGNSQLLVTYYYWTFPLGLGLTLFTVLEAYAWNLGKSVLTNFLKEVQWRLFITIIIVLFAMNVIKDYSFFIKCFAFTYPGIAVTLFIYLGATKKIHFTFKVSKVSRRFFKKIVALCLFIYSGTFIFSLSQVFDTFVIASLKGLDKAGIYILAAVVSNVVQAPQRSIIAASISHLAKGWKEKNIPLLQKVYQRSSLNLLIFSCGIFLLLWMNFADGVTTFGLKPDYLAAADVLFLLGLTKIVDMGTGVNAQLIVTSTYWKFELFSGLVLLSLMLPLTYLFAKQYGIIGPAIANLISMSIYNFVRIIFLWVKFKLFPFTLPSVYTLVLAAAGYGICHFAFHNMHGLAAIALRSILFIIVYAGGVLYFNLSPDVKPVIETIRKRLRI
ncbi:MAG: oligosaccharide flippase family protein [Bacteroidetes bacterium]|nr:oligosaccharide flippase family protein [Bacteroidota bacterium]MBS1930707.1 oligosaccharide flippase family protein [Bacteroidota bacterium]